MKHKASRDQSIEWTHQLLKVNEFRVSSINETAAKREISETHSLLNKQKKIH